MKSVRLRWQAVVGIFHFCFVKKSISFVEFVITIIFLPDESVDSEHPERMFPGAVIAVEDDAVSKTKRLSIVL